MFKGSHAHFSLTLFKLTSDKSLRKKLPCPSGGRLQEKSASRNRFVYCLWSKGDETSNKVELVDLTPSFISIGPNSPSWFYTPWVGQTTFLLKESKTPAVCDLLILLQGAEYKGWPNTNMFANSQQRSNTRKFTIDLKVTLPLKTKRIWVFRVATRWKS